MPNEHHPDKPSLEPRDRLVETLKTLKAELHQQLDASAAGAEPVDLDEPIGRLSRMDAIQQQHMLKASRRAQKQRLDQINAALSAATRGEYGICRKCEEPIDLARLEARPEATFCLTCQGQMERR